MYSRLNNVGGRGYEDTLECKKLDCGWRYIYTYMDMDMSGRGRTEVAEKGDPVD